MRFANYIYYQQKTNQNTFAIKNKNVILRKFFFLFILLLNLLYPLSKKTYAQDTWRTVHENVIKRAENDGSVFGNLLCFFGPTAVDLGNSVGRKFSYEFRMLAHPKVMAHTYKDAFSYYTQNRNPVSGVVAMGLDSVGALEVVTGTTSAGDRLTLDEYNSALNTFLWAQSINMALAASTGAFKSTHSNTLANRPIYQVIDSRPIRQLREPTTLSTIQSTLPDSQLAGSAQLSTAVHNVDYMLNAGFDPIKSGSISVVFRGRRNSVIKIVEESPLLDLKLTQTQRKLYRDGYIDLMQYLRDYSPTLRSAIPPTHRGPGGTIVQRLVVVGNHEINSARVITLEHEIRSAIAKFNSQKGTDFVYDSNFSNYIVNPDSVLKNFDPAYPASFER